MPLARSRVPLAALLMAALLAALATTASATTVVRLSPDEVDALAHRIVEARVVASHEVQVAGSIRATEYELSVERVLKDDGSVSPGLAGRNGILVIRQIPIVGMPRYREGARYRLALTGESSLGLTSPVGLGQGVRQLGAAAPAAAGRTP